MQRDPTIIIKNKHKPLRSFYIICAVVIGIGLLLLLYGCVTVPVAEKVVYLEHPATQFWTESDFSFEFAAPERDEWEVLDHETDVDLYGLQGLATITLYVDKTGVFECVGLIVVDGKIERIALGAFNIWAFYDRFEATDTYYKWSLDAFLNEHHGECVEEPEESIDKSGGI